MQDVHTEQTISAEQEEKEAEKVSLTVQLSVSICSLEEISSEREIINSIVDLFAGKTIEEVLAHGFPTAQFDNLVVTKRRVYTQEDRSAKINLIRSIQVLPSVRKSVRKKGVKLV